MNAPVKFRIVEDAIDRATLNRGLRGADWLANQANIPCVFDNGDVALFDHEGEHDYEVHFLFTSGGRLAIDHARESFRFMFEQHGAELIFGLVPDHRRDVKLLARWAGGKSAGIRPTPDGDCELFVLSKIMWMKDEK
jgi:hypothetical protein